jgi:hypothetical protein
MRHLLVAIAASSLLVACAGGGGGSTSATSAPAATNAPVTDGRVAAVQKMLDANPETVQVPHGRVCGIFSITRVSFDPKKWAKIAAVHEAPAGSIQDIRCTTFTWDSSANVHESPAGMSMSRIWFVVSGRAIADSVGADIPMALGRTTAPYTAHFIPSDIGKRIIAAAIVSPQPKIIHRYATVTKNADGTWTAQP